MFRRTIVSAIAARSAGWLSEQGIPGYRTESPRPREHHGGFAAQAHPYAWLRRFDIPPRSAADHSWFGRGRSTRLNLRDAGRTQPLAGVADRVCDPSSQAVATEPFLAAQGCGEENTGVDRECPSRHEALFEMGSGW